MRKTPFAGIELTSQRVRGLQGTSELPGRLIIIKSRIIPTLKKIIIIMMIITNNNNSNNYNTSNNNNNNNKNDSNK